MPDTDSTIPSPLHDFSTNPSDPLHLTALIDFSTSNAHEIKDRMPAFVLDLLQREITEDSETFLAYLTLESSPNNFSQKWINLGKLTLHHMDDIEKHLATSNQHLSFQLERCLLAMCYFAPRPISPKIAPTHFQQFINLRMNHEAPIEHRVFDTEVETQAWKFVHVLNDIDGRDLPHVFKFSFAHFFAYLLRRKLTPREDTLFRPSSPTDAVTLKDVFDTHLKLLEYYAMSAGVRYVPHLIDVPDFSASGGVYSLDFFGQVFQASEPQKYHLLQIAVRLTLSNYFLAEPIARPPEEIAQRHTAMGKLIAPIFEVHIPELDALYKETPMLFAQQTELLSLMLPPNITVNNPKAFQDAMDLHYPGLDHYYNPKGRSPTNCSTQARATFCPV